MGGVLKHKKHTPAKVKIKSMNNVYTITGHTKKGEKMLSVDHSKVEAERTFIKLLNNPKAKKGQVMILSKDLKWGVTGDTKK